MEGLRQGFSCEIGRLHKYDTCNELCVNIFEGELIVGASGEFVKKYLPHAEMELLPYHKFGFGKYEALGMDLPDAAFGTPTKEKMEHLKGILREIGISLADFK